MRRASSPLPAIDIRHRQLGDPATLPGRQEIPGDLVDLRQALPPVGHDARRLAGARYLRRPRRGVVDRRDGPRDLGDALRGLVGRQQSREPPGRRHAAHLDEVVARAPALVEDVQDAQVDVGGEAPVDLGLAPARVRAGLAGAVVEEAEVHRLEQLVRAVAEHDDPGHMGLDDLRRDTVRLRGQGRAAHPSSLGARSSPAAGDAPETGCGFSATRFSVCADPATGARRQDRRDRGGDHEPRAVHVVRRVPAHRAGRRRHERAAGDMPPGVPLPEVAELMTRHRIHAVVVLADPSGSGEDDEEWGVISELDLVAGACMADSELPAGRVAATPPVVVGREESIDRAAFLMADHQMTHLIVMKERPAGIVALDITTSWPPGQLSPAPPDMKALSASPGTGW